ncbi:MAG: hypothetical protein A3J47_01050 [Candidatus Yanofskybacteria bacterium RIFCSPHIGHO2_02_FULL_43_22]|uniref:Uncharacterized protein n=1 Tax=Candidatus Yanofskybacteria bacterium RIFCSPHIGHO2_02_FULL_43_22 TaxID=1802681 RepID=A0A1F8FJZ8_9BACT|nr:MAG: hypothetical protein A3J47_01050 [Candidatus Yanofskybacteria bacterium RIFCSPHIGHO2_02_FULL_43_22]
MRITVKAKPNSHEEKIDLLSSGGFGPPCHSSSEAGETGKDYYVVSVKEPPVHGLANKAIIKALSDYFGVSQVRIRIVSGYTSRQKVIEIL